MEEEIDLREYIDVLIRYWKWIAGLALIAAIVAGVVSFLLPPVYEARAMVVVTKPKYRMQFDPRFEAVNEEQLPYKAYPALALNDDLLLKVIEQLEDTLEPGEQALDSFRGMLEATAGSDPSVIELRVSNHDPQRAALIANTWAELYVQQVNELYGESTADAAFFEQQLQEADQELAKAEEALIAFQERNRIAFLNEQIKAKREALAAYLDAQESVRTGILSEQIKAKREALASYLQTRENSRTTLVSKRVNADAQALSDYLNARNRLRLLIQDAQSLREQVSQGHSISSLGHQLLPLFLEVRAFGSGAGLPVQIQIPATPPLASATPEELTAYLDDLIATLEDKEEQLSAAIEEISQDLLQLKGVESLDITPSEVDPLSQAIEEISQDLLSMGEAKFLTATVSADNPLSQIIETTSAEILALQKELQEEQTELDRLTRRRDVARETYMSLSRKVEETRIAAESGEREVRLASKAAPPDKPVGPKKKLNVAIAGALGLMVGVFGAFAVEYFRETEEEVQ